MAQGIDYDALSPELRALVQDYGMIDVRSIATTFQCWEDPERLRRLLERNRVQRQKEIFAIAARPR